MRNGRTVNRAGHNPPIYNYAAPHEPDDSNADDEATDAVDLPDSCTTYAETLIGNQPRTTRKPNELPEKLPAWVTPRARAFLESARLTKEQIRRLLTSRDLAARRVCEHAEALVSSWSASWVVLVGSARARGTRRTLLN